MKKLLCIALTVVLVMSLVGCSAEPAAQEDNPGQVLDNSKEKAGSNSGSEKGNKQAATNEDKLITLSNFNFSLADKNDVDPYETIEPLHNVPEDKVFTIKLNLGTEPFDDFTIERYFAVYTDRECQNELICDVYFDREENEMIIRPDENSWGMYARKGVDSEETRNWGGLQTYYLLISHDVNATKVTALEKPKRMMFTVQSKVDIPTVTVKHNEEGNYTLYWRPIEGVTEYKIYRGSRFEMVELGRTQSTEFILTEDKYRNVSMNSLVSSTYDYAVVALKGEEESRLSNIIDGEDLERTAISQITYGQETSYRSDKVKSILDLPLNISVDMAAYEDGDWIKKSLPIVWDFDNIVESESGLQWYEGKILGTTFKIKYLISYGDKLPTKEEIAAFKEKAADNGVNVGATDTKAQIDIPNAPTNADSEEMETKDVNEVVSNDETPTPEESLEAAIAIGMLTHQEEIDLSAYKEASDPYLLKDVLLKVITQYPLILDEYKYGYDYPTKTLTIGYRWTKEEALVKQVEVIEKVVSVVKEVITPDMTVEQKEQALHDWILENGTYHTEVLEAYYAGEDMNVISEQYADTFNPYGILINGLGVCQSYAEAYKLLCNAAEVPCVVASGLLGTVPHAWNKVRLDGTWYHVDATNNDGEGAIPYAIYNSSDSATSPDFTTEDEYVLDSELEHFVSDKDDKDYYMLNGNFAQTETELKELLSKHVPTGKDFYIKVTPKISYEEIRGMLKEAYKDHQDIVSKARFKRMFNVLKVFYID